jgi:hypothetical protein
MTMLASLGRVLANWIVPQTACADSRARQAQEKINDEIEDSDDTPTYQG